MRVAVTIISLCLVMIIFFQSSMVGVGGGLLGDDDLSGAAGAGIIVAFLYLIGGSFAIGKPSVSRAIFVIASLLALLAASASSFSDMFVWSGVSAILAVMSHFGVREIEAKRARTIPDLQHANLRFANDASEKKVESSAPISGLDETSPIPESNYSESSSSQPPSTNKETVTLNKRFTPLEVGLFVAVAVLLTYVLAMRNSQPQNTATLESAGAESGVSIPSPQVEVAAERCQVNDVDINDSYTGGCVNGLAHGKGVASGRDRYEGDFVRGLPEGVGIYSWGDASDWPTMIYEGHQKAGSRYGFGIVSVASSDTSPGNNYVRERGVQKAGRYVLAALWDGHSSFEVCNHTVNGPQCLATILMRMFLEGDDDTSKALSRVATAQEKRRAEVCLAQFFAPVYDDVFIRESSTSLDSHYEDAAALCLLELVMKASMTSALEGLGR